MIVDAELNEKEQRAADAIQEVMLALKDMDPDREPWNFTNEAIPAIHTLQMFVLMHWAHRIHPDYWADWFDGLYRAAQGKSFQEIMGALTSNLT